VKIQAVPLILSMFFFFFFFQVGGARIFITYGPRLCLGEGKVACTFVAAVGFWLFFV